MSVEKIWTKENIDRNFKESQMAQPESQARLPHNKVIKNWAKQR